MSAIALLMGLLVLSYIGSVLVGGGKKRGLASGIEFIGLGLLVGPRALGLVDRAIIAEFQPIIEVALGWLAFVIGLDFGRVEGRRVTRGPAVMGLAGAAVTGAIVAYATYRWTLYTHLSGTEAVVLVAGASAVGAETARYGVDWVKTRWNTRGPLTRLFVDMGAADDLAPLVVAGVAFAFAPASRMAFVLPTWGWFAASVALGGILGIITSMLLRGAEGDAVWGALIGTLLLVVGTAARFGLCTIFVTFTMGIALAATSPNRRALRKMVGPTERPVLYPMLLLAGARIDIRSVLEDRLLLALVALILLARIGGKLVWGVAVRAIMPAARPAGPLLGLVLLSSGPVSMSCGLVLALRFPGRIGDTLLLTAAASAVLGELVSTLALRGLLSEAGEVAPPVKPIPPPPPSPPPQPKLGSVPPPPMESRFDLGDAGRD
jgi:hypothetical protein